MINVEKAVPFFRVKDMTASLRFYVDGLGFRITKQWIPQGDRHYSSDGRIRWCWLELGNAAIMLQEEMLASRSSGAPGVSISFQCSDALTLYREFSSRGITSHTRPYVGNGLWVVSLIDPDGYLIDFSSPTDAPEESELGE